MQPEYWGISLDNFSEAIWVNMGIGDNTGSHYIAFMGDRQTARQRLIDLLVGLLEQQLYRANAYGSPWKKGDDEEEAPPCATP